MEKRGEERFLSSLSLLSYRYPLILTLLKFLGLLETSDALLKASIKTLLLVTSIFTAVYLRLTNLSRPLGLAIFAVTSCILVIWGIFVLGAVWYFYFPFFGLGILSSSRQVSMERGFAFCRKCPLRRFCLKST